MIFLVESLIIDIFAELCSSIHSAITFASFPSSLKLADVTPFHKKREQRFKRKS